MSTSSARTVALACGSLPDKYTVSDPASSDVVLITGASMVLSVLTTRVFGSAAWRRSARLSVG